MIVWV